MTDRTEFVEFSKRLKFILEQKYRKRFTRQVFKTVGPNPFISIGIKDWKKDTIPNNMRVMIAKALGINGISNWSDVNYGNIRDTYVTLHYSEWKRVLDYMNGERGGMI